MHKDLSDEWRGQMERAAQHDARALKLAGQSLALAREAFINAFDRAAEELDAPKPMPLDTAARSVWLAVRDASHKKAAEELDGGKDDTPEA